MATSDRSVDSSRGKFFVFNLFVLFCFVAASFWAYRYGLIALPRGDDIGWILTRSSMKSDWDFFVYSMFRGRGDAYLFRPAFHFVLSTMDIFFRENLYAAGALSVLLHGLVSFLVFILLRRLVGLLAGVLLAVVFLTQLVGMEMVLWRHISWYLFGLIFFLMGLISILSKSSRQNSNRKERLIGFSFLLSALFHESFAYTLLVTGLILAVFGRAMGSHRELGREEKDVAAKPWVFLWPPLIYLALNVIVAVCFMGRQGFAGSLGHVEHLKLPVMIQNIVLLSGLFAAGFSMPGFLGISFPAVGEKAELSFSTVSPAVFSVFGLVLLTGIAVGIFFVLRKWKLEKRVSSSASVALMVLLYLLILILSVGVGRLTLRDITYVKGSSYYFYFSNFACVVLLAFLLRSLRGTKFWGRGFKDRAIDLLILMFAVFQIAWNYSSLQKVLMLRYPQDKMIADANLEIASFFKKNQADCYGGSLVPWPPAISPNFLLFRERCSGAGDKGLYVDRRGVMDVWLSALPSNKSKVPIEFDEANPVPIDFFMESKVLGKRTTKSGSAVMSKRSYQTSYYGGRVTTKGAVGLVFAFRDPGNYAMLVIEEGNHFLMLVQNGQVLPASIDGRLPTTNDSFEISVRTVNHSPLIFCDQNVVAVIQGLDSLEGMVGICDFRASPSDPPLSGVLISEDFSEVRSQPVVRLEKLSSAQQSSP